MSSTQLRINKTIDSTISNYKIMVSISGTDVSSAIRKIILSDNIQLHLDHDKVNDLINNRTMNNVHKIIKIASTSSTIIKKPPSGYHKFYPVIKAYLDSLPKGTRIYRDEVSEKLKIPYKILDAIFDYLHATGELGD